MTAVASSADRRGPEHASLYLLEFYRMRLEGGDESGWSLAPDDDAARCIWEPERLIAPDTGTKFQMSLPGFDAPQPEILTDGAWPGFGARTHCACGARWKNVSN
jgi:hypothetical protein